MTSSIILMSDRRVAAIPVKECGEDLVDVRAHGLTVDDCKRDEAPRMEFWQLASVGTGQAGVQARTPLRSARPRSSVDVGPETRRLEIKDFVAGRAWVSCGAHRSAASRVRTQSLRRPRRS